MWKYALILEQDGWLRGKSIQRTKNSLKLLIQNTHLLHCYRKHKKASTKSKSLSLSKRQVWTDSQIQAPFHLFETSMKKCVL